MWAHNRITAYFCNNVQRNGYVRMERVVKTTETDHRHGDIIEAVTNQLLGTIRISPPNSLLTQSCAIYRHLFQHPTSDVIPTRITNQHPAQPHNHKLTIICSHTFPYQKTLTQTCFTKTTVVKNICLLQDQHPAETNESGRTFAGINICIPHCMVCIWFMAQQRLPTTYSSQTQP